MVNTIWFRFDLIRLRKEFPVCITRLWCPVINSSKIGFINNNTEINQIWIVSTFFRFLELAPNGIPVPNQPENCCYNPNLDWFNVTHNFTPCWWKVEYAHRFPEWRIKRRKVVPMAANLQRGTTPVFFITSWSRNITPRVGTSLGGNLT